MFVFFDLKSGVDNLGCCEGLIDLFIEVFGMWCCFFVDVILVFGIEFGVRCVFDVKYLLNLLIKIYVGGLVGWCSC